MRVKITEVLSVDLESETWHCNHCNTSLGSARENYKKGCLIHERELTDIYQPVNQGEEYSLTPDKEWCSLLEFYCPSCARMLETEYLPPGHPITHDIEIDIDELKRKAKSKQEV